MAPTAVRAPSFRLPDGRRLVVNTSSREALLEASAQHLDDGVGFTVATLNLDHLVKLRRDAAFRDAYAATTHVVADGNPVVWLARLQGAGVALAPGSDLTRPFCTLAARRGAPVALFGSSTEALERAAGQLAVEVPALRIAHSEAPSRDFDPFGAEADACAARIAASGARLCLLALGAPKQEIFAVRASALAPGCGFVSVGAGLDFLAGVQKRAPRLLRRLALEWAWRLATDPRRLAGRYAACAAELPFLIADSLAVGARSRGAEIESAD